MKTPILMMLTLALATSAFAKDKEKKEAVPAGCDLRVELKILERKEAQSLEKLKGAIDRHGGDFTYRNSADWYASNEIELAKTCQEKLLSSYKLPNAEVVGLEIRTSDAAYSCSKVYHVEDDLYTTLFVDIVRTELVREQITLDEMMKRKCSKLAECLNLAKSDEEIEWVNSKAVKFGCMQ